MEKEINIAEILKDKLHGIKLYSPIFGNCTYLCINDTYPEEKPFIRVRTMSGGKKDIPYNGKYDNHGEIMLFPSKEMRDWSKFTWKKGDVLTNNNGQIECIFEKFTDEEYRTFKGKYTILTNDDGSIDYLGDREVLSTLRYTIEDRNAAQCYINTIEKRLGGKLNMETLEIEKSKFKEGDIIKNDDGAIVIVKKIYDNKVYYQVALECGYSLCYPLKPTNFYGLIANYNSYATEEEKQLLFNALEKEGKRWNAETKQIEDIKPKWTPKPFDKVIVRSDEPSCVWHADIFSHIDRETLSYVCIGDSWTKCLPYNEETAKLIGTINDYK